MAENIKYINADELYINLDTMKNPDSDFATDDYIDGFSDGISAAIKELEIMPATDVAKVVRCKDCKYYEIGKDYEPYCNHINGLDETKDNDFCSYGKRKEYGNG